MKILLNVVLCVLYLFLFSCSDNVVEPQKPVEFFPLVPGYRWIYQTTLYDTLNHTISKQMLDTIILTKKFDLGVNIYYYFNQFPYINKSEDPAAFIGDSCLKFSETSGGIKRLIFKMNTIVGDSIIYYSRYSKTVSTDMVVNSPAGNFKCILYSSNYYEKYPLTDPYNHYFARGIGLVKFEQFLLHGDTLDLIKNMILIQKDSVAL